MSSVFEAEPLFAPDSHMTATHRRARNILLALLVLGFGPALAALPAASAPGTEQLPFMLSAKAAILVDQATGRVLFERNADAPMAPASLAKLMTLHLVYERLEERTISWDDVVTISPNAWGFNQAPGSSLMNLEPGQIVTVGELMKGMAIASGNDAATALAEYVGGSKEKFVRMMNDECRWMGYTHMRFTDPAGVEDSNQVTAREFADFCRRYIDMHPQSLPELLSLREFEYPQPWNLPLVWPESRKLQVKPVKQYNANFLVWNGIDGLKTGHLDENNFTAAITIKRGDTRLIAVILGVCGRTLKDGYAQRAEDCMNLLTYGFRTFATLSPDISSLKPVRVWKGSEESVGIAPAKPLLATVRKNEGDLITYAVVTPPFVVAPVQKGSKIGELVFYCGEDQIATYDLLATQEVEQAGIFKRMWDAVMMGVDYLLGRSS